MTTATSTQAIDIPILMADIGVRAKSAAAALAIAPSETKTWALDAAADAVLAAWDVIITANAKDLDYGRSKNLSAAMLDRLLLDEGRI
ncbi:MAG: gamma-glutamyl-phosphate reductase, partial [Paracoccaceae bacterium]|nr:gamma-glutamyl-phosphate reductase [Paracoccaceae bacterium]